MNDRVLFVDDEENILSGYKRNLRREFSIDTAISGQAGLELIERNGPYPVVVSDMRMPQMNGVEFLTKVCQAHPDTARIMLTGQADMNDAIAAVNDGQIFRFLTKPCPPEILQKALDAGIRQHQLVTAERELLEKTLKGSITVLTNILSLVNPMAFSRGERIKPIITHICQKLALADIWQYELAAVLSQIGLVTVPQEVMDKLDNGDDLDENENAMIESCPSISHDLLWEIPRLDKIAKMIAWQQERYVNLNDTSNYQAPLSEKEQIKAGAQLLKVALAYDDRRYRQKEAHRNILDHLQHAQETYNPTFVSTLASFADEQANVINRETNIFELNQNMILNQDVVTKKGVILAAKGSEVTLTLIKFLENYAYRGEVDDRLKVKELQ